MPTYIRSSHCRQIELRGVAIQSSSSRSRGVEPSAIGQRVLAVEHDVGPVVGERGDRDVVGHGERHVAPLVHDPEVGLVGGDEVDGVPGLTLGHGDREVGVGVEHVAHDRGHQPADGGREGRHPQPPGHGPCLPVQSALQLLEASEQRGAALDEVTAVTGEDDAAADPLEERDPGAALEALDLLGDR